MILNRERARWVLGYWPFTDRILLMKIQDRPFNISIIVVYAHTSNFNEEENDMFYENLDMAKAQCKSQKIIIVIGDLNSLVESEGGSDIVGKNGLGM